jgi:microcystin-dependent protein
MEPFIGQLALFPFGFAPRGWAPCNGQLMPIGQNQALYSLLGTQFGGDGRVNFALPNLQGRVPVGSSRDYPIGSSGGENAHMLTLQELPTHSHALSASNTLATASVPNGNVFAATSAPGYGDASSGTVALNPAIIPSVGGSQPHENRQPFAALSYCIAVQGIFPSRA